MWQMHRGGHPWPPRNYGLHPSWGPGGVTTQRLSEDALRIAHPPMRIVMVNPAPPEPKLRELRTKRDLPSGRRNDWFPYALVRSRYGTGLAAITDRFHGAGLAIAAGRYAVDDCVIHTTEWPWEGVTVYVLTA
ncbi:MAG TPA: hypothetical protein VM389_07745 [Phycisphaerae bacterium]|nr:hypothetical protein [Phycisphaerae bacterium]HUU58622.1 hypothetical protein [Phycisphaerae bacterium]